MKSMKLYFSLLLAAVMFVMPVKAQDIEAAAEQLAESAIELAAESLEVAAVAIDEAAEEIAIEAEAEVAAVGGGSQGRDNSAIDNANSIILGLL